jgi:ABC-type branched-subunit amino acid transport system substrate-binding protein
MKKTKLFLIVLILCLFFAASFAWSKAGADVPKFGALIPLTGPLSEFAQGMRWGGQVAETHFLRADFPVDVIYYDTETSAIPGVTAARTLVDIDKVLGIIGASASGVTMPVAESVTIPAGVPQISNASTSPVITDFPADEGKDFLFRTVVTDAVQGVVLGQLATEEGYKNAAVMWINSAYGQGLFEQFKASFEHRGGKVVADVAHEEKPAPTYVSELRKIMEANPDVLLCISYPGHATVYLKEFFEAGYGETTDLLFCDGTKSIKIPEALGANTLAGLKGTVPAALGSTSKDNFIAGYTELFNAPPPLPYQDTFYDAVAIFGLAAAAVQAKGMELTPVNVRDMLRYVANPPGEVVVAGAEGFREGIKLLREGKDINYEGASGPVDFNSKGDVVTPIEIFEYTTTDPYIKTVRLIVDIPEI